MATVDNRVVGFMALQRLEALPYPEPWLRITGMCVTADQRGKGIGRSLEKAAFRVAQQKGCGRLEVTCSRVRRRTHRFYHRLGYQDSHLGFTKPVDTNPKKGVEE
jgi:GNAT superfamily N-acetyltransferase